ncbi:hypothetical protein XM38_014870 [Halomicronema hongdechloris C2206]|uniref:Uncharacterized protein n=1 Tax=Halomicronema hongdechloris C2206 TaxID=1641165 RepID=A0A1Z3HKD4_9CYAN|nr:hypothetical protein [Halomicronema hongdechloris]ASC70547.1 hypothetical protein XM38_014870 [Halomicronema hongdechloris C2206]
MARWRSEASKYDLQSAEISGAIAKNVHGDQVGSTINNYGANLNEINRLLTTLRKQAQTFFAEHKDEALDLMDDLEAGLQKSEPDPERIGRRLKRLVAVATAVGTITAGAVTFSEDLNELTANVIKLTETLNIPVEQIRSNRMPPTASP